MKFLSVLLFAVVLFALVVAQSSQEGSTEIVKDNTSPQSGGHTNSTGGNGEHEGEEEDEGFVDHIAVSIAMLCLAITFGGAYFIEEYLKITFLPEAAFAVIVGFVVSGIIYACQYGEGKHVDDVIKFDKDFFFVWLLPPIIFEAGYNMHRKAFFSNIVPTVLYAFIGTFISTLIIGGIVYAAGESGLCHQLGVLPSFVFGALVSATDPVTVLAVFQALGVNINLFSMVFGESVLNDAVALVLYRTLLGFKHKEFNGESVFEALVMFTQIFVLSTLVGLVLGALCSIMLKIMDLRHHEAHRYMEAALTVLFPWSAYFLAESFELSGIVAILFAGITMATYAFDNLSQGAQTLTQQMYKVLAKVAETFVFVYLGISFFSFQSADGKLVFLTAPQISLAIVSIVACLVSRAFNIYPCSFVVNLFRGPNSKMPPISSKFKFVMWWSGLRGGVAFAIAVANHEDNEFPENENGLAILQATLFVAVFTIFVFGGSITKIATKLQVLEDKKNPSQFAANETGCLHAVDVQLKKVLTVRASPNDHAQLHDETDNAAL